MRQRRLANTLVSFRSLQDKKKSPKHVGRLVRNIAMNEESTSFRAASSR